MARGELTPALAVHSDMRPRVLIIPLIATAAALALANALAQIPAIAPSPSKTSVDADDLFTLSQTVFETYTVTDRWPEFARANRKPWEAFTARLDQIHVFGSLAEIADYEQESRTALVALRELPEFKDFADRLAAQLDETAPPPRETIITVGWPRARPQIHAQKRIGRTFYSDAHIPLYDIWVDILRDSPRPRRSQEFMPALKRIFADEGVPTELAWLAEAESMFNPRARSVTGARGLFQLMPDTAKEHGLRLRPNDERTDPHKNARAAAIHLRELHETFNSWPLALAAYNAGEGCVRRSLKANRSQTFAGIADDLPNETRLYVPRVLATLAVREGLDPIRLAALSKR